MLILDHQEQAVGFNHGQQELFLQLASDSRFCPNYHTIVTVSNLDRAEAIMKLGEGSSKFRKLGTASMFKWLPEHIHQFVERADALRVLPLETQDEITKLGIEAGTCGYMFDLCAYFSQQGKGTSVVPKPFYRRAKELQKVWRAAAKWDENE